MSASLRTGWLLLHVAVTFLAFPQPWGGRVVDLGGGLAWLLPLTAGAVVHGLAPRRAFGVGLVAGVLAHGAVLHWIWVVTVRYGHAPPLVGVLAPLLLAVYPGLFQACWSAALAALCGRRLGARLALAAPWALAAGWAALDHGRTFVLSGFPWASLGYAQHATPLLALAPWTGVVGLSFATVLGSFGALGLVRPALVPAIGRRAGALALLGAAVLVATARGVWAPPPTGDPIQVAVIQGNIEQGVKWSPDWAERTLAIYAGLTRRAAQQGAELVAWPETAVPGAPDADPELAERLAGLARETGTTLVVGAVGVEPTEDDAPPRLFDSAFVITEQGLQDRYDKAHLVPFGEYLPLRGLLGRFVRAIATGSAGRDVTAGGGPRAVRVPLRRGEVRLGLPVCFELLFPDLMRRFAADGAQALIALTNDAWYGRTGAPYQFLAITALRAAESGLWIARAANTGASARIDGRGRVRSRTAIFESEVLVGAVPLRRPDEGPTFYVRHGDLFAWSCWAFALGFLVLARRAPRRSFDE